MSFANFQKKMFEKELPEVPSLLPKEKRDADLIENLKEFYDAHISAISKNPDLLPFIGDVFGISEKADISCIENLLKETPAVKEPFFEQKEASPQKEVASASSFRTASGKVLEEAGSNKSSGIERECNVDEYIVERIKREIIEKDLNVAWGDIVGLDDVKRIINEIVLWPISRPDIFTGLRKPPKGLLLFGPPGTGKTMIGKCIASQCKATFFSISASSLTSKWVGEGEKMVRALFYLARKMAPSVVFIDEIDSLLSQRSENENEGSRRIKTEFLVQFDGAGVENDDKHILIIGATNRPQEIDEAARRRLVKRVYVPLPDKKSRKAMIRELVTGYKNDIGEVELDEIARLTDGYSGSDIFNLCREATLEPLREIEDIKRLKIDEMRAIKIDDFYVAMRQIRKSVSEKDLNGYVDWNNSFGSMPRKTDKPKP